MGIIKQTWQHIFKRHPVQPTNQNQASNSQDVLLPKLEDNVAKIRNTLGNSSDFIFREAAIGQRGEIKIALMYTEGLTDPNLLQQLIDTLLIDVKESALNKKGLTVQDVIRYLQENVLTFGEVQEVKNVGNVYSAILSGDAVVLVDGYKYGLIVGIKGGESRSITEPVVETVIRGPREGFTERFGTNVAMIRRKIKSTDLWLETQEIGRVSKTKVGIMYLHGIANKEVVDEVQKRLNQIDIDAILESNYIEELIQDETYTPFPTIYNTERPDTVAAGILEGRVAIIVDGTPFVLLVPALFTQFFQASEDYYSRAEVATLVRFLRLLCLFIALLVPSLYVAIITFHFEMLPTPLLNSLAAQREGVPFPAFIEALMMEVTFEILREAGIRMPRAVGQAISIVGALVIGQAVVQAGIISAAMVIVVSITAISNFVFPSVTMGTSIRILRFGLMFLAASFGLFGITVGLIAIVLHLCSLRSFGIPYMSPMAPFILADQKDTLFRVSLWGMFSRPRLISQQNIIRENNAPTKKPISKESSK